MKVPSPGESISEVEIAQWLVETGDYVEKDQEIAEIDSDKATLTLSAEADGVIELLVEDGDTVAVGQVVCKIDTEAEGSAAPKKEKKEESSSDDAPSKPNPMPSGDENYAKGHAGPAAQKAMREAGVTVESGSGKNGRVLKEDVIKAKAARGNGPGERGESRKKMSSLRRKIAERLVSVKNETAMLTTFNEVDMTAINEVRAEFKEAFKAKHETGLGFMSFFTRAVSLALEEFPDVNSQIDGQEQVKFDYHDIGIAVSSPKGLMVPVVRNAEDLNFPGIEKEIKRLAVKARDGKIEIDDMLGGTFTITNGGVFGSMLSTPIINPPQSAILGMHNIVDRPMAIDGKVEIRPIMYVALSYDHRIIDGKESVGFLVKVKECLENPVELLMDGDAKKWLDL